MKIIKARELDVTSGDVVVLEFCQNETGNTVTGEVDIQTSTNLPFSVTASVDGANYAPQTVFNMGIFDLATTASVAGHYMFPAAGLHSAKITFTGSGKVFIKEIY